MEKIEIKNNIVTSSKEYIKNYFEFYKTNTIEKKVLSALHFGIAFILVTQNMCDEQTFQEALSEAQEELDLYFKENA